MNIHQNNYHNIPQELRVLDCWVGVRLDNSHSKAKKLPINPKTGRYAAVNNPDTWGSYNQAIEAIDSYDLDGIGFVFCKNGYIGIDIDNCIINNHYSDMAQSIIQDINSYTELSISGTGVHIIVQGVIPQGFIRRDIGLEMYDDKRYFAFTGDIVDGRREIIINDYEVAKLYNLYANKNWSSIYKNKNVEEIVQKAVSGKHADKVIPLLAGDLGGYNNDHSAADLGIVSILMQYADNNPELVDEIIRHSPMYRAKWDQKHYANGDTYGSMVIKKAIQNNGKIIDYLEPWYEYNIRTERMRINTGILASYLIKEYPVINIKGNIFMYKEGYYQPSDKAQRYAIIKSKIADKYVNANIVKDTDFSWIHDESCMVDPNGIDAEPFIINVKNGLYHVIQDTISLHNPRILSTIQLNCNYDVDSCCPTFLNFLNESVDLETIILLQELMGYVLIPVTAAQKCIILVGPSNTGKSTFLKVIQSIIGNNNISNVALQNLSDRFAVAELYGKLVNICPDLPTLAIHDTGTFKILTGEDTIVAERKYEAPFTFMNKARLLFSCNRLPDSFDKTDAFYSRLIIIPFTNQVTNIDPYLSKKLDAERDGIFMWALTGLKRLISNNYQFTLNSTTNKVLEQYRVEQQNVRYFVQERCVLGANYSYGSLDLYHKYIDFCTDYGLKAISIQKFASDLLSQNPTIEKTQIGDERRRTYIGISVKNQ